MSELVEQKSTALESSEAFKNALTDETSKRKLLKEFIANGLTEGVDYGKIKIGGKETKPTLFKSGAEKFTSLLKLVATFETDEATRAQLPEQIKALGVFCYDCKLIDSKGNFVSQGKGACGIAEKGGQINTAIKIAKKRSLLDAVIGLGLSDVFTQDLEDMADQDNMEIERLKNSIIDLSEMACQMGVIFTPEQITFIDECTMGKKSKKDMESTYAKLSNLIKAHKSQQG